MKTIRITSLVLAAALTSCYGPMQNGSYPPNGYASTGSRYSEGPSSYYPAPADQPQISRTDLAATQSSYTNSDGSTVDEEGTAIVLAGLAALALGAMFGGGDYESSSSSSEDDALMRQHAARQQANRSAYYSGEPEPYPGEGR